MANVEKRENKSHNYEWLASNGAHTVSAFSKYRARLHLVQYALDEAEFIDLADYRTEKTHSAWDEFMIEILSNKAQWVFTDPHGDVWRCFQTDVYGEHRMIVTS